MSSPAPCSQDNIYSDGSPEFFINKNYTSNKIHPGKVGRTADETFWNMISKPILKIPKCMACEQDNLLFLQIKDRVKLADFECGKLSDKIKCSHHCLWFEWAHNYRIEMQAKARK